MDTWMLLCKELDYYGIRLIDNKKCEIYDDDGGSRVQGVIMTIREIKGIIKKQKKILLLLWDEMIELLQGDIPTEELLDDNMMNLFVFSLKDLSKFLLCFEGSEKSKYYNVISFSLTRD
ncbi:MAG: hypothetical protein ACTSSP_10655, partial [Candidatus Asgardarchaeia archaeon]